MRFVYLICFLFIALVVCDDYQSTLQEPYKSAEILRFDAHGWLAYPNELKREAANVAKAGGKVFVELGSWLGLSTRYIASMIPDDAKLYAVDTWKGSQDEQEHLRDPRLSKLYEIFLSNCIQSRLAHRIEPIRMSTEEAGKIFDKKIDFLFIDAAHGYNEVYNDIITWYPKLSENGVICGDDWTWETVRRAAIDAADKLGVSVFTLANNFWMFDRKKKNKCTGLEQNYS